MTHIQKVFKNFNQGFLGLLATWVWLSLACTAAEPTVGPATPLPPAISPSLQPIKGQPTEALATDPQITATATVPRSKSTQEATPSPAQGSVIPPPPTETSGSPEPIGSPEAVGSPERGAVVKGRIQLSGAQDAGAATITVNRISERVTAETVAADLEVPWALAFTPDGRMLVTERSGRIRIIQDDQLLEQPMAVLDVGSVSEAGLMGIAVDPDFADNGHLYVCYTYRTGSQGLFNLRGSGGLFNRIARLTDSGGQAGDLRVILDHIPAARNHNGCRMRFGPDGKLYVTMGDAQSANDAQNLDSLSGKILRLERDGSVPADNPFPGSYIYSYGHRNPQGLDWHPETGDLFITEHGPSEDDEINILAAGGNYGWPRVTGMSSNAAYLDPILAFTPTIALAGAAFYTGESLGSSWDGDFIFANLKGSHLRRIGLKSPDFRSVDSQQILFLEDYGRLRAVALGPDGHIYFSTSNRDGRGRSFPGDDKILRLIPEDSEPALMVHLTAQGDFNIDLEPGAYRLAIAAPGYSSYHRRLVVYAGKHIDLGLVQLATRVGGSGSP